MTDKKDMKKIAGQSIKLIISLSIGIFLIWIVWKNLTPEQLSHMKNSIFSANYWWILVSVIFGILSHLSRAYRWKYTLEPLGLHPRFWNSFFSVMIGYLLNLAFPRLGEVTRCGVMSKYENLPVNKLFGTVIAERVADLIIMIIVTSSVIFLQLDVLNDLLVDMLGPTWENFSFVKLFIILSIITVGGIGGFYFLFRFSANPVIFKIKSFLIGIYDGIKTIITMKQKWGFLFHTIFIWVMYVAMFYVSMLSIPETSNVPVLGVISAFVMGGLSIIFVQGGIGAYPPAIAGVLLLYGVSKEDGLALGWIMWTGQTVLLIALGFISMALLPLYNKNKVDASSE